MLELSQMQIGGVTDSMRDLYIEDLYKQQLDLQELVVSNYRIIGRAIADRLKIRFVGSIPPGQNNVLRFEPMYEGQPMPNALVENLGNNAEEILEDWTFVPRGVAPKWIVTLNTIDHSSEDDCGYQTHVKAWCQEDAIQFAIEEMDDSDWWSDDDRPSQLLLMDLFAPCGTNVRGNEVISVDWPRVISCTARYKYPS